MRRPAMPLSYSRRATAAFYESEYRQQDLIVFVAGATR